MKLNFNLNQIYCYRKLIALYTNQIKKDLTKSQLKQINLI